MVLKKLLIERETWGEHKGEYKVEIKFDDDKGAIELILPPNISSQLLTATADEITTFSMQAAESLRTAIADSLTPVQSK